MEQEGRIWKWFTQNGVTDMLCKMAKRSMTALIAPIAKKYSKSNPMIVNTGRNDSSIVRSAERSWTEEGKPMNDLISRKALIAEYDRVHIGAPGGARKLMEDAPTVDAISLKYLEHIIYTTPGLGLWDYQKRLIMSAVNRLCGAKMDGDGNA
jgi:hypothetical protein